MSRVTEEYKNLGDRRRCLWPNGMLLAGPHAIHVSTNTPQVLFTVREGCLHTGMPPLPPTGNAARTGDKSGRTPVLDIPDIRYSPRSHARIRILNQTFEALLDIGSEATFINKETATLLQNLGCPRRGELQRVWLADGFRVHTHGTITCPFEIWGQRIEYEAQIMQMDIAVLVGVDLWALTRQVIPPPPIRRATGGLGVHRVEQIPHDQEETRQLERFLAQELPKFNKVQGPTNKTEHVIRVTTNSPIKQRYRP